MSFRLHLQGVFLNFPLSFLRLFPLFLETVPIIVHGGKAALQGSLLAHKSCNPLLQNVFRILEILGELGFLFSELSSLLGTAKNDQEHHRQSDNRQGS